MAGHASPDFVSRLHSQVWYPQYAGVFADAGIPEWIPDAIVANEDPSLSLTAVGDAGASYGLFQINTQAHTDISPASAMNPISAAHWSADRIAPILALHPEYKDPGNVGALVKSLESAGWPGGTGLVQLPDGSWYDETSDRVTDAQTVITGLGGTPSPGGLISSGGTGSGTPAPAPGATPTLPAPTTAPAWDPFGLNALWGNVSTYATSLSQNIFFGALALALIAGGFVWLASTNKDVQSTAQTAVVKGVAA
jgi:hypothetical protein